MRSRETCITKRPLPKECIVACHRWDSNAWSVSFSMFLSCQTAENRALGMARIALCLCCAVTANLRIFGWPEEPALVGCGVWWCRIRCGWTLWSQHQEIPGRVQPKRLRAAFHGRWSSPAHWGFDCWDLQARVLRGVLLHAALWRGVWEKRAAWIGNA